MSSVINQDDILSAVREKAYGGSGHGVTDSEWKEFRKLLLSVKSNDSESKTVFPDFVSEDGFIEHFHVTSGKSSRKGYDITKEESKMQQSHEDFMNTVPDNLPKENDGRILMSQHHTSFWRQNDSVDNFHKSFKTCWKDHINHLHDYTGNKHISCFLISSDDVLAVYEHFDDTNGIWFGDLAQKDRINFCLSYDYELLDYIYGYKNEIDYVIYYNTFRGYVEVIKVSNIPAIKEYLPNHRWELYPLQCMETSSTYGMHIPNFSKGD